jgi:excisionase family DNA binding protein
MKKQYSKRFLLKENMCEKFETDLLTVGEASEMLRLKPSTMRSWLLKRRIPYIKLGSRVFIRRLDCIQLIENSIVTPIQLPEEKCSFERAVADSPLEFAERTFRGFPVRSVTGGEGNGTPYPGN